MRNRGVISLGRIRGSPSKGRSSPHPAEPVGTTLDVAFRGNSSPARFELGQPGIGFLGRDVEAGGLIAGPRGKRILPELLALLLAFHRLPMYALLHGGIEVQATV